MSLVLGAVGGALAAVLVVFGATNIYEATTSSGSSANIGNVGYADQ